ncbi:hypothetical protein NQ318_003019 [Aromia moschata]|uniref:tRNA modification GTPase GTPBP3, mitochondrial n=1 Tax=Aromia moschata TaxID=1265417 RepID=A0AAV8YPH9_9CUCU|nr:hypothetical protein NQ318_003019 [Aromia moschata]
MILKFNCSVAKLCKSLGVFNFCTLQSIRSLSSDTVFALSSGQGKCGVAVIRISGPHASNALKLVTKLQELPKPRTALLKSIVHPVTQEVLDKGLVLWFPGPKSFTGEDSFELQVHGGLAVINAVLNALGSVPKLRLAEPGEFSRRAFQNAKLDLTEVEGLADLLQAETELQRKQAFLQTQGSLSKLYNRWKSALVRCVARIEAQIDFEETDTLELDLLKDAAKEVKRLADEIEKHLSDGREPNVGKSSLLNVICQRPAAIVTPLEGTTRDVLEVTLNIDGYPLVLADTAGLRSKTDDIIEKEGISRALQLYKDSDLLLLIADAEKYLKWRDTNPSQTFSSYVKQYADKLNLSGLINHQIENFEQLFNKHCIVVLNKTDLGDVGGHVEEENVVEISCKTKHGISDLVRNIAQKLKLLCGDPSHEHPSMNQMRHRQHLTDCLTCLRQFLIEVPCDSAVNSPDLVLSAEYLRKALRHLGKLVGTVTTDQLLDVIFRDFCIGK